MFSLRIGGMNGGSVSQTEMRQPLTSFDIKVKALSKNLSLSYLPKTTENREKFILPFAIFVGQAF